MPRDRAAVVLLAVMALLGSACSGSDGDAASGADTTTTAAASTAAGAADRLRWVACPVEVPAGARVDCAVLTVPEDRSDPSEGEIELAVAVLRSTAEKPAPDPVVYLEGGPGGSALDGLDSWLDPPSWFLDQRDVVLVDQRGTGWSEPSLNCPEVEEEPTGEAEALRDAHVACAARLRAGGVELAAYDSTASAADVDDLRRALGLERWNLLGVSYGTRLALTVLRDHPAGVRSAILDSVYPPDVPAYEQEAANARGAIDAVFAACAADRACDAAYPDLWGQLDLAGRALDDAPQAVTVVDPYTGDTYDEDLDGASLVAYLFGALYDAANVPWVPATVDAAARGDAQGALELLGVSAPEGGFGRQVDDRSDAELMYYAVECREEVPFNDPAEAEASMAGETLAVADGLLDDVRTAFRMCDALGVPTAPQAVRAPVRADVPTLLLAGQFDPITPPAWAERAASILGRSSVVVLPGLGHAVIDSSDCPLALMLAFLDDPGAPLDTSCVAGMTVDFELP
ncbi:MAG: alpha/beta fold hydrolase [Acidimicrobiales bacterium]|nr:alpha/beta fold hydrolase [Acidimicrobiales bacterium]